MPQPTMDQELARELQEAATSDLLDFPRFQHNTQPATDRRAATLSIQTCVYSPNSKLEVILSPSDIRPPFLGHLDDASTSASDNDKHAADDGPTNAGNIQTLGQRQNNDVDDDDNDDKLPSGGLSSKVGSVTGLATILTLPNPEDAVSSDLLAQDGTIERSPSKLRERTSVNDVFLNEFGERVVNGIVVGRIGSGRRRREEQHRPTTPLQVVGSLASTPVKLACPSANFRPETPPAFFLESFPDALVEQTKKTLSITIHHPTQDGDADPGTAQERDLDCPSLTAPRAVTRVLDFGGNDLDSIDDHPPTPSSVETESGQEQTRNPTDIEIENDNEDKDEDHSYHTAFQDRTISDSLSQQSSIYNQKDDDDRLDSITMIPSSINDVSSDSLCHPLPPPPPPPPLLIHRSASISPSPSISSSHARNKLKLETFSRKPTPLLELSIANTDHVTLHGNKRQAQASEIRRKVHEQQPPSDVIPTSDQDGTNSNPTDPTVATGSNHSYCLTDDHRNNPTYLSALSDSQNVIHEDQTSSLHHITPIENQERTSLDSISSSLVSLSVSTITGSSNNTSNQYIGTSSLERRPSGGKKRLAKRSDSTIEPEDCFVRQVYIRGWKQIGSQVRGWIVYEIKIITQQVTTIHVFRRFRSFIRLRQTLFIQFKQHAKWLPLLPSKTTGLFHKYDAKYLEKRRKDLEKWLQIVMLDPVWGSSEALRDWVLDSVD